MHDIKDTFKKWARLAVVLAALTFASGEAQAQWVITDLSNPNVITFDQDIGWDGQTTESTLPDDGNDVIKSHISPSTTGVSAWFAEYDISMWYSKTGGNANRVALSAQAWSRNNAVGFEPYEDYNSNGLFTDADNTGRFRIADKSPIDSSDTWGAQVSVNNGSNTGGTLRILNDTGVTQTNLQFELDAWWAQLDADNFDHTGALSLSYSLDNSSFTEFYNSGLFTTDGSVNNGTQPWTSLGTVGGNLSATWNNGDYLYIRAEQTEPGARVVDVFTDDWTLSVVPEPSTPLLLLAGLLGLTTLTRRRS